MTHKTYPILQVELDDSCGIFSSSPHITVGYLTESKPSRVTVAQSYDAGTEYWSGRKSIRRNLITQIATIRDSEK